MLEIIKFLIEGLIMGFLGLFGIVGNVVSIAVLSSTELDMMPAFRHLMKMLGAFDAIFLVITCVEKYRTRSVRDTHPNIVPHL